jgi:hypothetical protein
MIDGDVVIVVDGVVGLAVDVVVGLGLGNFPSPVGFVPPPGGVEPFIGG